MTFIVPGHMALRVAIRKTDKRGKRVLTFSKELVRRIGDATHVAVDIDEKTRTLTFYPSGEVFKGQRAHKLVPDGGSKNTRNCVIFGATAAEAIKRVRSTRYDAEFLKDRFEIRWGKS